MSELAARYLFHLTPERMIWLADRQLSWDARCAGIYAGFGIALLFHLLFRRHQTKLPPWPVLATAAVLSLPMLIDVISIHFELRGPSNLIRHLTGSLFGICFCSLLYPGVRQLFTCQQTGRSISPLTLLLLAAAGAALSCLILLNRPLSYYLLESLSWFGFSGLAVLIAVGLYRSLRPANQ